MTMLLLCFKREVHCRSIFSGLKEGVEQSNKQDPSKPEKTASKDPKLYSFLVDHDGNGRGLLVDCYGNGRTLLVVCYVDEELDS